MRIQIRTVLVLTFVAACSAPSGKGSNLSDPHLDTGHVADPNKQPPITAAEVVGYWSGDWGRLVLREENGRIIGAYDHDEGTINGSLVGDTFVGWWCEVPGRKPDHDAGDVELKFVGGPNARTIDGRWRYGTSEAWHDDWDLSWNSGDPPPELVQRFSDPSAFCTR